MRGWRAADWAGWALVAEGAAAGAAALVFGMIGLARGAAYSGSGDDSGFGAIVIALTLGLALVLAIYAPLAILAGRGVLRRSHGAWWAAVALSAVQIAGAPIAWSLLLPLPLVLMGILALALLALPGTRAECARPPELEDVDELEPEGILEAEPEAQAAGGAL